MIRWASLTIALAAAGCADYVPDVGPPLAGACDPADSDPDVDVSFARDVRPLFDRDSGMGGCGCHGPSRRTSGLDMGSLASLMNGGQTSGRDAIVPGDPCASVLLQKVSDTPPFGARMPLDGPPYLAAEELQLLHDWIAEGAQDN